MKYSVFIEWGLDSQTGPYENCFIAPFEGNDYFQDGDNYVSRCGSEGMKYFICDDLDEAVRRSGFNPDAITFNNIPESELEEKRT